ncbi:hypothetical protein JXO59_04220, partial [candidate division KSB1 bacterium]|nr:hypothetical protein [candidate division KSB1 bacterium]
HNDVSINGGIFQVYLGTTTFLNMAFDKPYFLGIQVGDDPEFQPRMSITSSAYAMRADDSNQLLGFKVSTTPQPNMLLPLDASGKFPSSVLSDGGVATGDYLKKDTPDTSRGTSTSPMLLISNLGSGLGLSGRSTNGVGIEARSDYNYGLSGWTGANDKAGVFGQSTNGMGINGRSDNNDGVVGWTGKSDKSGVFGHTTNGYGVYGQSVSNNGVYGYTTSSNSEHAGVYGFNITGNGVRGKSTDGVGVNGGSVNGNGIVGWTGAGGSSINFAYAGVLGWSVNATGVCGKSDNYVGVSASTKSDEYAAMSTVNEGAGPAFYASAGTGKTAAVFRGNIKVQSYTTQATIIELGEGLDYAEGFDVTDASEIVPGSVLVIDPDKPGNLTLSRESYDNKVAGIAAGARGLESGVRLGVDQFDCDIALAGRVYCNVDASYGKIVPGDLLTTSPTPGYAMAVKDHTKARGAILGKAMQGFALGEKGQILVLVTLQ